MTLSIIGADRQYDTLLVEDDAADALLIAEALSGHGHGRIVSRVGDGVAALEWLRQPVRERPDLIVLDLNMPRMNGWSCCPSSRPTSGSGSSRSWC